MAELSEAQASVLRVLLTSRGSRPVTILTDEQHDALEAIEPGMARRWLAAWSEWRFGRNVRRG